MADKDEIQIKLSAKDEVSEKMQGIGDKIGSAMNKASLAASAAFAGITAFAISNVKSMGEAAEATDNMAKSTGLSIGSISALKLAAEQSSIPIDAMTTAIKKWQLNFMNMDSKQLTQSLDDINLKFMDVANLKPEEQLFKIGKAINDSGDAAQKTANAVRFFGKAGADLLPLFADGSLSLEEWTAKAKAMGVYMDEGMVASAMAADAAFDDYDTTMKGLTATLTANFLPVVTQVLQAIQPVINSVTDWMKANPELTKTIIEWTVGIVGVVAALGPLIAGIRTLGVVLAVVTSPIGLVIAAIAALVAGVIYLYNTNETFRKKVDEVWKAVKETIVGIIDNYLKPAFEWFTKTLPDNLGKAWNWIKETTDSVWNGIKNFFIDDIIKPIQAAFKAFNDFMQPLWDALWKFYKAILEPIIKWIVEIIKGALESMKNQFMTAVAILKPIWEGLWNVIKAVVPPIWEAIKSVISGAWSIIEGIFNTIKSVLTTIWNTLWDSIKQVVTDARDIIVGIIDGITNAVMAIPKAVGNAVEGVKNFGSSVASAPGKAINWVKSWFAEGGRPPLGEVSMVGEKGPELFVPDTAGTIIPNNKLGGSMTIINNFSGNQFLDRNGAEKILQMASQKFFWNNKIA